MFAIIGTLKKCASPDNHRPAVIILPQDPTYFFHHADYRLDCPFFLIFSICCDRVGNWYNLRNGRDVKNTPGGRRADALESPPPASGKRRILK